MNWIVAQSWSNGKVGAIGNSYTGNTALWLASTMNPAVKAGTRAACGNQVWPSTYFSVS